MAIDYFIGTQAECEAFIAKMDVLMGYPNPATKTLTYAKAKQHFTNKAEWFVRIKPVYAPKLKRYVSLTDMESVMVGKELTDRTTLNTLETDGAFEPDLIKERL